MRGCCIVTNMPQSILTRFSIALLALGLVTATAAPMLRITEVMTNGDTHDWFELTNYGDEDAVLETTVGEVVQRYKMDDSSYALGVAVELKGISTIAPGESVIFIEVSGGDSAIQAATKVADHRAKWGLADSAQQVGYYQGSGVGFGAGGDGVTVFDFNGNELPGPNSGNIRVSFGAATSGSSFYYLYNPNGTPAAGTSMTAGTVSSVGDPSGGYTINAVTGSPCRVTRPPNPYFVSNPPKSGRVGILFNYAFTASALNSGESVTVTAVAKPAWLTLTGGTTAVNSTSGTLSGTPVAADAGDHLVTLRVTDSVARTQDQTFVITVFPSTSPVIVNEYNGVGSTADLDTLGAGKGFDPVFGTANGNGGDWFELVVVGNGTPAGTVDMRGWTIEIRDEAGTTFTPGQTIRLSQDTRWSAVPTGTILTFIEDKTSRGGLDTAWNAASFKAKAGWSWSNIWIGDTDLVEYTDLATNGYTLNPGAGTVSGIAISNTNTQFRIRDAGGIIVFGRAGEGILPRTGIGGGEVWGVGENPSPNLNPATGLIADSIFSSFGAPNRVRVTGASDASPTAFEQYQSFKAFATDTVKADRPLFTLVPRRSVEEGLAYGEDFNIAARVPDKLNNLDDLVITATLQDGSPLPSWLEFTDEGFGDATLTAAAGTTVVGNYLIRLTATEPEAGTVIHDFRLRVGNPLTPMEIWAGTFGLTGNQALPGDDSDLDGRTLFTEYAFGGNPTVGDGAPPSGPVTTTGSYFEWTFVRRSDDNTILFGFEKNPNLTGTWNAVAGTIIGTSPATTGYENVTVRFPRAIAETRAFFRATAN